MSKDMHPKAYSTTNIITGKKMEKKTDWVRNFLVFLNLCWEMVVIKSKMNGVM